MARNTKTPAADADSNSGVAAEADARAARDAEASTGAADPAGNGTPTRAADIEDAVIVSEEAAGPADGPSVASGSAAAPVATPPRATAGTGAPKSADTGGDAATDASEVASIDIKSSDAVETGAAAGGAKSRRTIGTGADIAEPDPRLGRGSAGPSSSTGASDGATAPKPRAPGPARDPAGGSERRGPGFLTLLLGGLLAGAIGYGAATYLSPRPAAPVEPARIESLEAAVAALTERETGSDAEAASLRDAQAAVAAELGGLSQRVATLEAAAGTAGTAGAQTDRGAVATPPAGPPAAASTAAVAAVSPASTGELTALGGRVDDVTSRLAATQDDLAALSDRVTGLDGLPQQVADLSDRADAVGGRVDDVTATVATLSDRIDTVANGIDWNAGKLETVAGDVTSLREDLTTRVSAVESGLESATERASSVEDTAEALARESARNQVRAALQSGVPYDEPLAVLGNDVPEPLSGPAATGIASQAALISDFPALSREALRQARAAEPETGVGSLFRNAFGARSLEPREGDDPDAVLSRAEAAVRGGDLPMALSEIEALPAAARDALADWTARARTRVAAQAAADDFLNDG